MQMQSIMAGQSYAAARPATQPVPGSTEGQGGFGLLRDFATALNEAETTARAAMVGDADPHALVQALTQTELAVETAVSVRDKVVEAYQEILRMPV